MGEKRKRLEEKTIRDEEEEDKAEAKKRKKKGDKKEKKQKKKKRDDSSGEKKDAEMMTGEGENEDSNGDMAEKKKSVSLDIKKIKDEEMENESGIIAEGTMKTSETERLSQEKKRNEKKGATAWFPSARVVKNISYDDNKDAKEGDLNRKVISIALFYQYVRPLWSEARKKACMDLVEEHCRLNRIGGRVRVGQEGINATVSGVASDLRGFAEALRGFDDHFKNTDFKYLDNLPLDRAFNELKVMPVNEIVYYGIAPEEELGPGGVHLDPVEYHKKLGQDNTVVIDVRNNYEYEIGRFEKQQGVGGAECINPCMRKSTDFPAWISSEETKKKLAGKEVLMYCTGGVRCERASALLKKEVGDSVRGVYQLHGGIEKYMQTFSDGGYWKGKNFVFDKREAVGAENFNGVGGVLAVEPKKKKRKSGANESNEKESDDVLGQCCHCHKKWDRYIGKKKCKMCGVPVLLCQDCCTNRVDKLPTTTLRCALCVAENCTVPVSEVEFTDNGVRTKQPVGARCNAADNGGAVAAKTVCKWGGGHAKLKKRARQQGRSKSRFELTPCKYGKECTRADCWFAHQ